MVRLEISGKVGLLETRARKIHTHLVTGATGTLPLFDVCFDEACNLYPCVIEEGVFTSGTTEITEAKSGAFYPIMVLCVMRRLYGCTPEQNLLKLKDGVTSGGIRSQYGGYLTGKTSGKEDLSGSGTSFMITDLLHGLLARGITFSKSGLAATSDQKYTAGVKASFLIGTLTTGPTIDDYPNRVSVGEGGAWDLARDVLMKGYALVFGASPDIKVFRVSGLEAIPALPDARALLRPDDRTYGGEALVKAVKKSERRRVIYKIKGSGVSTVDFSTLGSTEEPRKEEEPVEKEPEPEPESIVYDSKAALTAIEKAEAPQRKRRPSNRGGEVPGNNLPF